MKHHLNMSMLLALEHCAEHEVALGVLAYHNILLGRVGCEGRGVDIERRCSNVSVNNSHRSVG
jgi:hypothetical protein